MIKMLGTMEIKSNTIGKLKKIHEGKSFSDRMVIISELFQNSYRAEAKKIEIELIDNLLIFKDDGCGCKKPENILTLDQSNWKTTDEGFGIGLWSWLAVPEVENMEILSNDWKAKIDVETIFSENNPVATIERSEKLKGFMVKIKSDFFQASENKHSVLRKIISDGELQPANVYLNGDLIEHRDLQEEVEGDFVKEFKNNLFTAKLSIEKGYSYPNLYYEKREVSSFYVPNIVGVIEMKKDALTLQEPDRKNIIWDDKKREFERKIIECRKELYKDFIKTATEEEIDKYAETISEVLDIEDYEKFVLINDIEDIIIDEVRSIAMTSDVDAKHKAVKALRNTVENKNKNNQLSMLENNVDAKDVEKIVGLLNITNEDSNTKWIATDEISEDRSISLEEITVELMENIQKAIIGGMVYKKVNIEEELENFELEDEESVSNILSVTTKKKKKKSANLGSIIKRTRRKVWIKAKEVEEYQELIARAEYYGVKVFIAKNVLYENIFNKYKVPYITEVKDGIRKRNFINNVGINTKKEQYFLELLQPILEYFNLPENTFLIGNLKMYIETVLDDVVVHREIIENKKGNIKIYGLTDGKNIILDRRAIGLQRFNLNGSGVVGINEYKVLLATISTIAHELAHLLYDTEDNTKEHFQKEEQIKREIINLYLTL